MQLWVTWQRVRSVSATFTMCLNGTTSRRQLTQRTSHCKWRRNSTTPKTWRLQPLLRHVVCTAVIKRDVNVSELCWWWYVLWIVTPCVPVNAYRRLQGIAVLRNVGDANSRHGVRLIGAFAIFRNATFRFVMSVRPSFCPHGSTRLQLDVFSWNFVFEHF